MRAALGAECVLQGDIVGIVDASGSGMVEYEYDVWGKIIARTSSLASTPGYLNPFRYRGYAYDEETGLYYLRSRQKKNKMGVGLCITSLVFNLR